MSQKPPPNPRCRTHTWRRGTWIAVAAMTFGCGAEVYQKRLNETISYFEYKDQLERELGREWSGKGIRFRPPAQFSLIPPPSDSDEDDSGAVFIGAADDPRQPHYLGIELPGLLAAWEAEVAVDSDGDHKAYLYLLGNHGRSEQTADGQQDLGDPQTFIADVERLAAGVVGVFLPEGAGGSGQEDNRRRREVIPGGLPHSKYVRQQDFISLRLVPEIQPLDAPLEMQLYEWEGKNVQVVLLMVYPADVSPQEGLQDRLRLAMETFAASDQISRAADSSDSADPSGGSTRRRGGF